MLFRSSEAAHALKAGRPLVLLATPEPWQELLSGLGATLTKCASVAEAIAAIERLLASEANPPGQTALGAGSEQRLPVALVQLSADDDAAANRRRAERWLERALASAPGGRRPRLLMLPEVWNAPYAADRFAAYAEPIPDLGLDAAADPLVAAAPGPDLIAGQIGRAHV